MGIPLYPSVFSLPSLVKKERGLRPTRRQGIAALVSWRACSLATFAASSHRRAFGTLCTFVY